MGSGKTSTGQALAELLGWAFVDLDEEIERLEHLSVREIFRERGEETFRKIEHEALRNCLAQCSRHTIVALGGGAFVQPDNVELLRGNGVHTVFVDAPVEDMLRRCGIGDDPDPENPRPLAANANAFRRLHEQRLPSYRAAGVTIDTSGKTAEDIAAEIAGRLQLT